MSNILIPKRLVEISLFNVAALSPAALVQDGEREYHERLHRAADAVIASGSKIIMLTGPSGSGKTTTSHKLAQTLESKGVRTRVISLDNFFIGSEHYPILPNGKKDYESPATLDMPEINRCLVQLSEQGWADVPVYDFAKESRADYREHIDLHGGVCIVEGIHALNPALTALLPEGGAFNIYAGLREEYSNDSRRLIDTRDIRLCRRILRDVATRGHSPDKTLSMWDGVLDGENKYVRVFKTRANFVLDTSHTYELGVIAGLVNKALSLTSKDCPYYGRMEETAKKFVGIKTLPVSCVESDSMLQEFYGAYIP